MNLEMFKIDTIKLKQCGGFLNKRTVSDQKILTSYYSIKRTFPAYGTKLTYIE